MLHIRADSLGRNWSDPYRLTDAVGKRENPTLCLGPDDELAVVWTDFRYSGSNPDAFVRRTGAVRDVAVTALFVPDTVDSVRDVRISVVVSNQGEVAEDFVTWLLMPDGWMDSVVVSGLGPGGSDTFEFGGWTAHARGRQVPACSIPVLPYDTCAANNVLRGEFFVRVVDVAVESLAAPEFARVLDTVRLNAMLYNPGNVAVEGWCRFEVADSLAGLVFLDSLRFLLPAGARAETAVSFVPAAKGRYRARAAVCAEGDMRPENDTGSCRFEVYEPEVRISGIVSPGPVVDSTDRVIPVVRVRNNSAEPVTCLLRLRIGERYADSSAVDSLSPGEAKDIEFGRWTAEARGEQAIACSLYLFPDTLPADVSRGATFVVVRDVVVDSVLAPRGEMRAGEPVAVVFQARNAGTDTARFDAFCRVEGEDTTLFSASQPVTLIPGLSEPVQFEVGRLAPGRYAARCSLYLEGEMRPDDDTAGTAFSLHEGDLWLTAIVAPGEEVDSGPPVVPRLGVRNTGEQPAGFEAFFGIGDGYAEAVQVPALQPGRDTVLGFPVWFPHQRGTHTLGCSLIALPDSVVVGPLTGSTFVVVRDAAAAAFVMPGETIPAGPVVPAVRFSNLGNDEGRAVGRLWAAGYEDSTDFVLRVGRDTLVRFAAWDAAPGRYELVAVVRFPGDMRPENDTCRFALVVDSLLTRSWQRLADLPAGAPARPVRRGARLVATGPGLFGLRASGTSDWLRYDPEGDSWLALARLPGERAARDGSAVCAGPGDDLFLIKGRGGREFLAYRSETNRWDQLESLPQGLRPVRYGTGMACVAGDTDKVYLATGGGRLGFLVYLVGPGRWHARRPVPPGPQGRGCRHGTDLVAARGRLFLLKGGSSEFYEYLPARDSWSARAGLPPAAPGRHRRTRAGAALAADGDTGVYALSGRGNEFWRYDLDADAWTRLEDVSLGDDRRRVGRGAALATHAGEVYLLKGGGCNEFWRYDPKAEARGGPGRSGVAVAPSVPPGQQHTIGTIIRGVLCLPVEPGVPSCVIRLFDATGRRVMDLAPGENDIRHLSPGIYFVRQESGVMHDAPGVRKLVIQR
ncbi:MAG: hypothetical protein R6X14_01490 [bacterium]